MIVEVGPTVKHRLLLREGMAVITVTIKKERRG